jgi:hypothetical protein
MKKIIVFLFIFIVIGTCIFFGFYYFKPDKEPSNNELILLSKEIFSQAAEEFHNSWTHSRLDPRVNDSQKTIASVFKSVYSNRSRIHVQSIDPKDDKFGIWWIMYTDTWSPSLIISMYISKYKKNWYISDVSVKGFWKNIQPLSELEKHQVDSVIWNLQNFSEEKLDSLVHPAVISTPQDLDLFKNLILGSRDFVNNQNCPLFYSDSSIDEIKKFIPDYSGNSAFVVECARDSQNLKITITQDGKVMWYRIF